MENQNMMNVLSDNMNIMIKSGQLLAQSFTEMSKTFAQMSQANMEANLAVMKAMMNAKSSEEVLDIQADHIKKSVDKTASDAKSLTDSTSRIAHESITTMKSGEVLNEKHKRHN